VKPVAHTKIHRPKGLAQALRRNPPGRLWASAPAVTLIGRAFNVACVTFFVRKKPDGSWDEDEITGTGFSAHVLFEVRHVSPEFPLLALATYVNQRSGAGYCPGFYRCDR